jgi:hypothetical protein
VTRRYPAAVLAAAVLVLGACGDDDDGDTTDTTECLAERPDGTCLTETDESQAVDAWAEYTRCVADDEVPNDECPSPDELNP